MSHRLHVKHCRHCAELQSPRRIGPLFAIAHGAGTEHYQIVVIDDGSPRPSLDVCAKYGDKVRYQQQENAGLATACDMGVRNTIEPMIAFTDDDC